MSDASIVYVTRLTMAPFGSVVYHLPRGLWDRTRCGRRTVDPSQGWRALMVPIRRDIAERIGYICRICGPR